jgi:hypothetical protein
MTKIYLTPQELSERFNSIISVGTLANWRCAGIGPDFTKIGGKILYPVDALIAWEKMRTVSGADRKAG